MSIDEKCEHKHHEPTEYKDVLCLLKCEQPEIYKIINNQFDFMTSPHYNNEHYIGHFPEVLDNLSLYINDRAKEYIVDIYLQVRAVYEEKHALDWIERWR